MASNVPTKIGRYDVVSVIGRGGMGVVYKAKDPRLDRQVAIKMMTTGFVDNPDLLKRFFREAQSLGSLQHPNIVTVYELGDYDGNPYLVMQYLEGDGLDTLVTARQQLSFLEKINIIIHVCTGLAYAHQRGVVHRDIKPANIMVCRDGTVKIFDFGIAHIGDQSVTKTGQMIGTPPYMSPEQVNGKALDARTDLFSTGVVLYQLLTNHLPFEGDSTANTFLKTLYDPPPPLSNFLQSYPPELETILLRALAKEPADRYHSAEELSFDLGQLQSQLKQQAVSEQMKEVEVLLAKTELYKAREILQQLLKTDPQHTQATQLLREVQQRIKKEEISEQVRKLRARAEDAASHDQFDIAQDSVEQAIALDKNNSDLIRLRDSIRSAALRLQKLHNALKLSESAHQEGDLDSAKQAIEEALQIAPDDAQAKALYRVIQRDWVERSRQRQMENYLFQARQDISSRKFTAALEMLKLAEALDPKAPQVHALMESAAAGREQERRRKDLEAIIRSVEDALNHDDYRGACLTADEGLERFPEERTLLKLKALADRQHHSEERRQFIDEQLAVARKLLQEGRSEELLTALESAIAKIGPEPRLQSLLTIVAENVHRERLERRKTEYLQDAKEALRNKQHDAAIEKLEAARKELKDEPEIEDLLQFAKDEATADRRRRAAEAASQNAQAFVAEQNYEEAIRLLEASLREGPDEELRIALGETRRAAVDFQQKLENTLATAQKLLQAHKATEVLKLLESQPSAYFRNAALAALLDKARVEAERNRRIEAAIEQSRGVLEKEDYTGARRLIERCRQENGPSPELDSFLAEIEQRSMATANRLLEKALGDARVLFKAIEYQAAIEKLQAVGEIVSRASTALRSEYQSLRQQCATALVHARKTQIERFVAGGELTRASDLLQQSLDQFPEERELSNLNQVLTQETKRRSDAREHLEQAQKAFGRENWKDGREILKKAYALAGRASALRGQVLDAFVQGGISAVESDWRAAEALLYELRELAPDYSTPSVLRSRIRERKKEESVNRCTAQCQRLLAAGQIQGALAEVDAGLTSNPDTASLEDLRHEILNRISQEEARLRDERARLEKENYLREVAQKVEHQPAIDGRIRILQEALGRYPHDPAIQRHIAQLEELGRGISAILAEARSLESAGKFDQALEQWKLLKTLHSKQPELDSNIARVTQLHDQARATAKAGWLQKVRHQLEASEFERSRVLLLEAGQQFPGDGELSRLDQQLCDAIKLRTKAKKLLAETEKYFEKLRWAKGLKGLDDAIGLASSDLAVRQQAMDQLVSACESAIASDLPSAPMLLDRAAALAPASPLLPPLRVKIEDRKRELAISERLTLARKAQQSGDLPEALRTLIAGLSAFPGDQRFIQAKNEVELQLKQLEEERAREREKARAFELRREREHELRRQEALEREKARALEEERKRQEAAEQEWLRAQEAERRRKEELEKERLRAQQAERERLEALERERIRAQEVERKLEQERLQAIEREKEREKERKQLEALEQERKQVEQCRLEEAQRLRDEILRKEEELRRERALAKQREKERKEQEKAKKRAGRERQQAEAAEKRRLEKEAQQQREEERRQELLRQKQEALQRPAPTDTSADEEDLSATKVFDSRPSSKSSKRRRDRAPQATETETQTVPKVWTSLLSRFTPAARLAVLAGSGLLVVLIAGGIWIALRPSSLNVEVTTSPDGASVSVTPVGRSGQVQSCVTPHCNLSLAPGSYGLEIQRDGYQRVRQTLEVGAKGPRSVPIALAKLGEPSPPPPPPSPTPEPGRLEVRGAPAGSELFVDDTSAGRVGANGEISTKVGPGEHKIKIVAKNKNSGIVTRNFEAGRVVPITWDDFNPKIPFPPGSQPAPKDADWQTAQGTSSIESMEQYLRKYPNGPHSNEASAMVDNLYWAKASKANSVDGYREYLSHVPQGAHISAALEEVAFFDAHGRRDLAALDSFVAKYPSSQHRAEVDAQRDELVWQQVNKTDDKDLNAYLKAYPKGLHADEARNQQQQLAKVTTRQAPESSPVVALRPSVDDKKAVVSVLEQYRVAYEHMNVDELKAIWPTIPSQGTRVFADLSSARLDYRVIGSPEINGDAASVAVVQSLHLVDRNGITHKVDNNLKIRLRKKVDSHGPNGGWLIDSIVGR